jgi:type I restriction enzyme R subunit
VSTDTTEKGLESLIVKAITGLAGDGMTSADAVRQPSVPYGGTGWLLGNPTEYDREYCVDLAQLAAFLRETRPEVREALDLGQDGPTRRKFLARLQGEVSKRGTIDVLRHGLKHGPHHIDLFYGTPSPDNAKAAERYAANRFSVTRQLRYSRDETQRALNLALFINGLPIATFELKNSLTKQTVEDAVEQYRRDRDPREKLFEFGRCVVHFAVDDHEVRFCTHLKGKGSWFLPFNQGWNDGAGNPPNPNGLKTDYLWKRILTRAGLTDILENYAQIVETMDETKSPGAILDARSAPTRGAPRKARINTGKKKAVQIWPRFH